MWSQSGENEHKYQSVVLITYEQTFCYLLTPSRTCRKHL